MNLTVPYDRRLAAARLAGCAQIEDIRVVKAEAELIEFGDVGALFADLEPSVEVQHEEGSDHFVVIGEYELNIRGNDDPDTQASSKPVARFRFRLAALFEARPSPDADANGPSDFTDDELEAYAETTGLLSLHPFARELIHDMTGRLGLPALTIGVARVELREEDVRAVKSGARK